MDDETLLATVVAIAGIVSAIAGFSQARTVVNQHKLIEAETYSRQRSEWMQLESDWRQCLLMAFGPERAKHSGIGEKAANELAATLEIYRQVGTKMMEISTLTYSGDLNWEEFEAETARANELVKVYEDSCRRIIDHLAQVSSLLIRKKVSPDSVYNALGPDIIDIGDSIRSLISYRWGSDSGCAAPDNLEYGYRQELSVDELSHRMGWGTFLRRSLGTAERILALQNLMMAHAYKVGDIDSREYYAETGNVHDICNLCLPSRLAVSWRSTRSHGRLRAVRLTMSLSKASRGFRRKYFETFDDGILRIVDRVVKPGDPEAPSERRDKARKVIGRTLVTCIDIFRVPRDCVIAWRMSKKVTDIRLLASPPEVQQYQPENSSLDENSYWKTWHDFHRWFKTESDTHSDDDPEHAES